MFLDLLLSLFNSMSSSYSFGHKSVEAVVGAIVLFQRTFSEAFENIQISRRKTWWATRPPHIIDSPFVPRT